MVLCLQGAYLFFRSFPIRLLPTYRSFESLRILRTLALWWMLWWWPFRGLSSASPPRVYPKTRRVASLDKPIYRTFKNRRKPQWVVDQVFFLAAISGYGVRRIADLFNQRYAHNGESVSPTYVYKTLKKYQYRIQVIQRDLKHKPPRSIPINIQWALDLTTVTFNQRQRCVLGIIDQGSRLCLSLINMPSKHSVRILYELVKAIRQYGFPKVLKTDNEACFTSQVMTSALTLMGIRHRKSQPGCPWQNGRIERFFGSFKTQWKKLDFNGCPDLQTELLIYQAWYNSIRPHKNLNGLTPKEVFQGKRHKKTEPIWVSEWQGTLTGYYFPD